MRNNLLIVFFCAMFVTSSAFASIKTNIFGVGSYGGLNSLSETVPIVNTQAETKGTFGYGGGISFEIGNNKIGFEFGAMYHTPRISYTISDETTTHSQKHLFVPGGVRLHLGRRASILVGGFFDYRLETVADGVDKGTYGVTGGIKLYPASSFFIEPRFNYYLEDIKGFGKYKEIMALIGWTFGKNK